MKKIQLQYVVNETTSMSGVFQQELNFFLVVENLAYEKKIDIVWAGEDEVWHTLPAVYHSSPDADKEYWQARATLMSGDIGELPGNIQFAFACTTIIQRIRLTRAHDEPRNHKTASAVKLFAAAGGIDVFHILFR